MEKDEIAAALDLWREGLVNLSGTNRLIKFRTSKTGALAIDGPEPDKIRSGLHSGWSWGFRGTRPASDGDGEDAPEPASVLEGVRVPTASSAWLHTPRVDTDLGPMLRNLKRRADTEFLDRGLSVLYLAFGMLHWKDVDDTDMASPLLLVPVALESEGPKSTPRLVLGEDDEVFNPALTLRMRDFGIEMPHIEDLEDLNVADLLDRVHDAVAAHPDWEVKPSVVLSSFSFHKEAMYRDLLDNQAQILAHPIVRALGTQDPTSQSGEFVFDPIDPADIDRAAPPEDTPLVLDADSSQRVAVAASVAGRTFVMDGPPGTGKSQTISNMIGALLHAGKTVLFVSEKAAALEVVRNRLADAGLENYLLELHSHKASRKEVAGTLARALDYETLPPVGMDVLERGSLIEHRKRLNEYAEAMNLVREPLDLSLHYVLGVLANLSHVPSAPIPETPPADLTQAEYRSIQQSAVKLERAWRPAAQGSTYLWREVADDTSLEIRLYQAERALEELRGIVDINRDLAEAFTLRKPSDAATVVALIDHQHTHRPAGALDQWLTADDWEAVTGLRDTLRTAIGAVQQAEREVTGEAGIPWVSLPAPHDVPASPGPVAASPAPLVLTDLDAETAARTAEGFDATANRLAERLDALRSMSQTLGLGAVDTYAAAERLMSLADFGFADHRPERGWLTPEGLAEARDSAHFLQMSVSALTEAEDTATKTFTSEALTASVADLHERFTTVHKGLRKLSGDYRTDKKTVAALLTPDTTVDQGIHHLPDAVKWVETCRAFEAETAARAAALGRYWNGRDTDFTALNDALRTATEVVALAGPTGVPGALGDYLTAEQSPAGYQTLIGDIRADLDQWKASLAHAPALTGRPELLLEPIQASIDWLHAHTGPLRDAATRTQAVDTATGRTHTLAQADHLLALRTAAEDAHATIAANEATYRATFEQHYQSADTNLDTLDAALDWAAELRTIAAGALTYAQAKALDASRPTDNLAAAATKWTDARDRIIAAFAGTRSTELHRELDDYRNAPEFINELRDDSIGQQEWFSYTNAREDLAARGLDTAIDFCIGQRVPANQVPQVIERALLRAWADHIIAGDRRLRPMLADDRAALIQEYRDLDRKLILAATSDIIRSANTRRPARTGIGEPGVIRREGMKKTRHMPVRDLIGRTKNTALAIKPVFMMSPLAVSQYLPPDMNFDAVIFDEASQVTPGDAINCIYRGKALILAGDDKQLPPTSFFERVVDEGDEDTDISDFQSVLELAKGCGAFNNLGLKWHYRSRHEALIAFSNYKFYDGNLVTYPSSHSDGPHVGVEFFHAHGTYRRGGGADNPIEAAKVAERVIHHFDTRPDLTLGVVTFSVAQADAIIDAIDKAREDRRDLDRFFDTNDRLDGFFVRSLESVQGDERDVILFSIGYGPDEAGKVTTNFGVLNKPKGWRRLNVAITRARQRVEVVASVRAGDVPPSENENVEHLRAYLDYAERGQAALAINLGSSGLGPDSPFEESVVNTIKGWGYTVEPQVGAAGFRIDIGVRHPAHPGVFALGVECDGYQYHSAPAARDRDRLREQILRGLGWELHRIWGTAWYRNRTQEEDRLKAAIHTAITAPADGRVHAQDRLERPEVTTVEVETFDTPTWTTEYVTADVPALPYWVDPSDQGSRFNMVDAMTAIATTEGPVHLDLVHQRVRDAWGIGRIGYKIAENIEAAIHLAEVTREDDFIDLPDRTIDRVRTPSAQVFRKAEQVHHAELRLAATLLLRDAGATPRADLVVGIARVFGWGRTGTDINRRINEALDDLLASGHLTDTDGHVTLPVQA